MVEGFSIVICTYNGSERIVRVLENICNLNTDFSCEVIVVDNASTDNVAEQAEKYWNKFGSHKIDFTILFEGVKGKTYALRKGIEYASYNNIVICDDDNLLSQNFLQEAKVILGSNEDLAMLGGVGEAQYIDKLPDWFDTVRTMYAVGPQYKSEGDITYSKRYVYGAGSIIRKSAWLTILEKGVNLQLSCRTGVALISGGDNEMGYLMVAAGFKVMWSNKLTFKHILPQKRLNLDYIKRMREGYAITFECIQTYRNALINGSSQRNQIKLLNDLLVTSGRLFSYWIKWPLIDKNSISFVLEYYFLKKRVLEIFKNWNKYPKLWRDVERNLQLLRINK